MTMVTNATNVSFDIKKYQKRMLGILKYIDRICRENDITYYLGYGTLIGAIRHKGFIPWDDDADVTMRREDYEKFVRVVTKDNDERYRLFSLYNNPEWYTSLARVCDTHTKIGLPFSKTLDDFHVFVDVMPLDGQVENDFLCKLHCIHISFYKVLAYVSDHKYIVDYEPHTTIKKLVKPFADLAPAPFWGKKVDNLAKKRKWDDHKFVCYGATNTKEGEITKDNYASAISVPFEDTELMVPSGYDAILRGYYGDYMQLPPEDKRTPTHVFTVYDLGED